MSGILKGRVAPRLVLAATLGSFILGACGPSLKTISHYVDTSPHRRLAVLPFASAPGNPNSGQEAADLISQDLEEMGFDLVDRADLQKIMEEQKLSLSGAVRPQDAIKLGQLLGVSAVLTGTVGEYSDQTVTHPPVFGEQSKTVFDRGHEKIVVEKVLLRPHEEVQVSVFSATARLSDVQTGALLWVGSGANKIEDSTVQDVAEKVLGKVSRQMGLKFLEKKL